MTAGRKGEMESSIYLSLPGHSLLLNSLFLNVLNKLTTTISRHSILRMHSVWPWDGKD